MTTSDEHPRVGDDRRQLRLQAGPSTYLLDPVDRQVKRCPGEGSEPRRDDEVWVTVVSILICTIGAPLVLVTRSTDGVARLHQSSCPVESIEMLRSADDVSCTDGEAPTPLPSDPLE